MASNRQIAANRRNAAKSTGPKSEGGKLRSRRNAYRHGLTAETVVGEIEAAEEFDALQAALMKDYEPQIAIERHLVARLASLLWRLRRTTLIETGLFEIEAGGLQNQRYQERVASEMGGPLQTLYRILHDPHAVAGEALPHSPAVEMPRSTYPQPHVVADDRRRHDAAMIYLRLCRRSPAVLKRLGRYETALWRQVAQTLLMLENVRAAKFKFGQLI